MQTVLSRSLYWIKNAFYCCFWPKDNGGDCPPSSWKPQPLLSPCKCELTAPLPIDWRSEEQELVEKVTLQSELWLSAMNRGPTRFSSSFLLPMHMGEWKLFQPRKLSSTSASWSSCSRNKSTEDPGHKMLCLSRGKSKRGIYHNKNFQESTLDLIIQICLTLDLIPPKSGLEYP